MNGLCKFLNLNEEEMKKRIMKYLMHGLAIALVTYYIKNNESTLQQTFMIAFSSATVYAILDIVSPALANSTLLGTGIGIGMKSV